MIPAAASAHVQEPEPITILESFREPRPTTNPYIVMLERVLRDAPDTSLYTFTWPTALFRSYDVFHMHWPEILTGGPRNVKRAARQVLTAFLLARLWLTNTPVVRTVHNLRYPEGIGRIERLLLAGFDKLTCLRIRINEFTPIPPGTPAVTIPHGHYRDWFERCPKSDVVPGQIGYVGLIRRYKGVEDLLRAFSSADWTPRASLRIGGRPSSRSLADTTRQYAKQDARISLMLDFLTDDQFVEIVTSSELIVLPYRFMHNSGTALTTLSLDRPVLVPRHPVTEALSAEVGRGWVYCFDGELTAETLTRTLGSIRRQHRSTRPCLDNRQWEHAGPQHVAALRRAITISQGRRDDRP